MTRRPKLYRPQPLERVEVEWRDAQHDTEFDGAPSAYEAALARTYDIGYFVSMTRETLALASCRDDSGTVRWVINIPTTLVRSITPVVHRSPTTPPQEGNE